jgi:predicted nucleic acid-binding protein
LAIPEQAVCDTSVILRLVHDHRDDQQAAADALRGAVLANHTVLCLLDLSVYEFVNVMVRRFGWSADRATRNVEHLFDLEFPMVMCDRGLAVDTARIAAATGLTGYDAAFVAAARALGVPLVTADEDIAERAPDTAIALRSIAS